MVVRIVARLLQADGQEGRIYRMTGPEALTAREIASDIGNAIGRSLRYVAITPQKRHDELIAARVPRFFADALLEQSEERLLNPVAAVHLEAHEAFGVNPTRFKDFAMRIRDVFAAG